MTYMQTLWAQHVETQRANRAKEALTAQQNEETNRHNLVTEELSAKDLNEKIRHQIAQDTETMRHNLVSEAEISRHNEATEKLMRDQNNINRLANELAYRAKSEATLSSAEVEKLKIATNKAVQTAANEIQRARNNQDYEINKGKLDELKKQVKNDTARLENENKKLPSDIKLTKSQTANNNVKMLKDIVATVRDIFNFYEDVRNGNDFSVNIDETQH